MNYPPGAAPRCSGRIQNRVELFAGRIGPILSPSAAVMAGRHRLATLPRQQIATVAFRDVTPGAVAAHHRATLLHRRSAVVLLMARRNTLKFIIANRSFHYVTRNMAT